MHRVFLTAIGMATFLLGCSGSAVPTLSASTPAARSCVSAVFRETGATNASAVSELATPRGTLVEIAVPGDFSWQCQTDAAGNVLQINVI